MFISQLCSRFQQVIYSDVRCSLKLKSMFCQLPRYLSAGYQSPRDRRGSGKESLEPLNSRESRKRFNPLKLVTTGMDQRLLFLDKFDYEFYPSHPTSQIVGIERKLISELRRLNDSDDNHLYNSFKLMWETLLNENESPVLNRQRMSNFICTFIGTYEEEWVQNKFCMHMPAVAKELGVLSTHIFMLTAASFRHWNDADFTTLVPAIDDVVSLCFDELNKLDAFTLADASVIGILPDYLAHAATAISRSSRWLELHNQTKTLEGQSSRFIRPYQWIILKRAFHERRFDIVCEVFENLNISSIKGEVYVASIPVFEAILEKLPAKFYPRLLEGLEGNHLEVPHHLASTVASNWNRLLEQSGMRSKKSQIAKLNSDLRCSVCGERLEEDPVTQEQVDHLKNLFYKINLGGGCASVITKHSNTQEFGQFTTFIDNGPKYDVIVDGLNYFHPDNPTYGFHREEVTAMLCALFKRLRARGKDKILIITRRHGIRQIPKDIRESVKICSVDNNSLDDMFILYAALSCGPDCYIFSSDKFSDHSHYLSVLQGSDWQAFSRWQRLRRRPRMVGRFHLDVKGECDLPLPVLYSTQNNNGHWHVPLGIPEATPCDARFPASSRWLCLPRLTST